MSEEDDFARELAELGAAYRTGLAAKLAHLEALRGGLESGRLPAERVGELQRELHSIAGSAKTFGLPAVTDAARAGERFLDSCSGAGLGQAEHERLRQLLAALAGAAGCGKSP